MKHIIYNYYIVVERLPTTLEHLLQPLLNSQLAAAAASWYMLYYSGYTELASTVRPHTCTSGVLDLQWWPHVATWPEASVDCSSRSSNCAR